MSTVQVIFHPETVTLQAQPSHSIVFFLESTLCASMSTVQVIIHPETIKLQAQPKHSTVFFTESTLCTSMSTVQVIFHPETINLQANHNTAPSSVLSQHYAHQCQQCK
jgi:hypothetical protein